MSDAAWRDMHSVPLEGEVHIGISDYVRPSHLATLLARIAEQYPGLRMRTQIDKSDVIAAAHSSGALDAHGIPHVVAHMASGVAGLQAAVAAGLGVACLNASAVIEADMVGITGLNLPALPTADIVLLPSILSRGAAGERLKAVGQIVAATLAP